MQYVLWTLFSLIAYGAGLVLLLWVTPRLITRAFDELAFMGFATLDILAALLVFGAVVITFGVFNGSFVIKVLDFFLLVGILIISSRLALFCTRQRAVVGSFVASRIIAGVYCVLLVLAALYAVVQLFVSR